MSLRTRLTALAQAVGADIKSLWSTRALMPVDTAAIKNVNVLSPQANTFDDPITWGSGRVLLFQQTNQTENGIWLFNGYGAAMTRSPIEIAFKKGQTVHVLSGNNHGGKTFVVKTNNTTTGETKTFEEFLGKTITSLKLLVETNSWAAVEFATTFNISLSPDFGGTGPSIDGARILLVGQTNQAENGIWAFHGDGQPLTRPDDADELWEYETGRLVYSKQDDVIYQYVGSDYPTVGTDPILFAAAQGNHIVKTLFGIDNEFGNLSDQLVMLGGRIAEPCMKVYTAQQSLTVAVLDGSFSDKRVLLTAQTNKQENGVYTYDANNEILIRVTDEIYEPGRLFPVVTQSAIEFDVDWAAPQIWACTEVGGSEGYTFGLISGGAGGSSGASTPSLRARVYLGNGPAATTVAAPAIVWQTKDEDAGGFWNPAQPTRLTAPEPGVYIVHANIGESPRTAGPRGAALRRDGVGWMDSWEDHALATEAKTQNLVFVGWLNAGQYFEVISTYPPATFGQYNGFNMAKIGSGFSSNPAKRVKGRVTSAGAVGQGTGFTSVRNAVGDYTITFSPAFGTPPIVGLAIEGASGALSYKLVATPTVNTFRVLTYNSSTGANVDSGFGFIAEEAGLGLQATMDVEAWHTFGAAGEPAYNAGFAAGTNPLKFRKTPDGKVHLTGVANTTAAITVQGGALNQLNQAVVAQLPVGHRPTVPTLMSWIIYGLQGGTTHQIYRMILRPDGYILMNAALAGATNPIPSGTQLYFDNVEFFTD